MFRCVWLSMSWHQNALYLFQDAIENGIDLSSNAFMLIHGWTVSQLQWDVGMSTGVSQGVTWYRNTVFAIHSYTSPVFA